MIPVYQSILHDPKNGKEGDCWRACVASILELPIINVPHFGNMPIRKGNKEYIRFLAKYGFGVYTLHTEEGKHPDIENDEIIHYFIIGSSPRNKNISHMVIGRNGRIVHDPHPDHTELASIQYFEILFKL